jgi:16S rRNA (guanine1516-N2)-methyltransferase
MVIQLPFWVDAAYTTQATYWQQQLVAVEVDAQIQTVDKLSARHLRLNPEVTLTYDESGLSLAANGMKMQPDWLGQLHRLKQANHRNELIARACQTSQHPKILDATAGLGHDGLLLAWLGADVTLLERHPVVHVLLQAALQQAKQDAAFASVTSRITLVHAEASDYLRGLSPDTFDVVYLDPMFPKSQQPDKKKAQVKKEMQILQILLSQQQELDAGDYLLALARQVAARVIVKRPRHAPPLDQVAPDHEWQGDACRFDGYFQTLIAG